MQLRTPADLARRVKNARLEQNLSQQDVADAVGITRQSLARIERGNGGASFDTVILILAHLGIGLVAVDATEPEPQVRAPTLTRDLKAAVAAATAASSRAKGKDTRARIYGAGSGVRLKGLPGAVTGAKDASPRLKGELK